MTPTTKTGTVTTTSWEGVSATTGAKRTRSDQAEQVKTMYLDVPLVDAELLAEVQMMTDLMIAASARHDRFTDAEIDDILDGRCDSQHGS